jgi:hypothetical protein
MPFVLKARCNHLWAPLPDETFWNYRDARERAATLLLTRPAGADMIAVCTAAEGADKGRAVCCLALSESRGARRTEWPGVWEWGPPAGAFEEGVVVADGAAALTLSRPQNPL